MTPNKRILAESTAPHSKDDGKQHKSRDWKRSKTAQTSPKIIRILPANLLRFRSWFTRSLSLRDWSASRQKTEPCARAESKSELSSPTPPRFGLAALDAAAACNGSPDVLASE